MSKPDLTKYRDRMDKAVIALKDEFGGLRTGRASASLLEPVMVEAYGASMPLNQGLGQVDGRPGGEGDPLGWPWP